MFFLGFSISPAIKVTLFHASELNKLPSKAVPKAKITAIPVMASQFPFSVNVDEDHMSLKFSASTFWVKA